MPSHSLKPGRSERSEDTPDAAGQRHPAHITVALAGNPNCGKSTIFNNLTGAHQHVGNYPGVTVEKREGTCFHRGVRIQVVDLPGIYSLTPYTVDEVVARNFIIEEKPDVVVDIVDASNLERNLYLTTQLIALRAPLVVALNMSDLAERQGLAINHKRLGELLGAPIIPTVGHRNQGTAELLDAILARAEGRDAPAPVEIRYGTELEEELAKLEPLVRDCPELAAHYDPRWLATKLLEDDKLIRERVERLGAQGAKLLGAAAVSREHLHRVFGESPEIILADRRYGFISGACQEVVTRTVEARHSISDRIDEVVLHRVLGLPIFLLLTYLTFQFTFSLGHAPTDWVEGLFNWLSQSVAGLWPPGSESAVRDLLCNGVIAGVGGVLTFVPYILLLFLAIAFLEDTGYMARAAFLMDHLMHKIGLHGKSFIPMLIGFGCSVPAILATRTLDSRRDRLVTMLVLPLMSCSARFVIYTVIVGAFFADRVLVQLGPFALRLQPAMYFLIYLIGVVLAILTAKLLRATVLRGETTPLVIELPPYRLPTLRGLAIHMWERGWLYVKKAGTIILGVSVILWFLTTYPRKTPLSQDYAARRAAAERATDAAAREASLAAIEHQEAAERLAHSAAGRIGRAIEPALRPLGFDWKIGTALIGAFAAKEAFVAQMGIVYAVGSGEANREALRQHLRQDYSPLVGFCIMLFCLISMPCAATIATTRRESGSWRWALFQLGGLTALAYVITLITYQAGRLLGLGA